MFVREQKLAGENADAAEVEVTELECSLRELVLAVLP
jgi:hypothetical protein